MLLHEFQNLGSIRVIVAAVVPLLKEGSMAKSKSNMWHGKTTNLISRKCPRIEFEQDIYSNVSSRCWPRHCQLVEYVPWSISVEQHLTFGFLQIISSPSLLATCIFLCFDTQTTIKPCLFLDHSISVEGSTYWNQSFHFPIEFQFQHRLPLPNCQTCWQSTFSDKSLTSNQAFISHTRQKSSQAT